MASWVYYWCNFIMISMNFSGGLISANQSGVSDPAVDALTAKVGSNPKMDVPGKTSGFGIFFLL